MNGFAVITLVSLNFALWAGGVWVASSAVWSGVKAGLERCEETYPVEHILEGNWFCPSKEEQP